VDLADELEGEDTGAEPLLLATARAPQALPPVALPPPPARAPAPAPQPLSPSPVQDPNVEVRAPAPVRDPQADDDHHGPDEEDTGSEPGAEDSELPERDGFGPLTWFAVLFMLAAVGYVGYAMMLDSQRRAADPGSVGDAADTAPSEATAADDAVGAADPADDAAETDVDDADSTPREDGLSFGTQQPGVRLEGATVPSGHGVLHVLETDRADVVVSVGDQELGHPPQQIALPEGRHAVRYRVGGQVIDRYYFVRSAHTRVVPVPES
jgi:hypothetical protein